MHNTCIEAAPLADNGINHAPSAIGREETVTIPRIEAAKRLGVSRTTIYRLCKEGGLRTVKIRRRDRILLASVYDLINGKEVVNV